MKWSEIMPEEIMQIGDNLSLKAMQLRQQGIEVYPPQDQVFRALTLTHPDKTKVCIIGQDPYHTPGAANGLAFSINRGRELQPSLQNIFKELQADIGCTAPTSGDLTPWAEQGVLLLNTSLTVQAHQANSHANWGWQTFTKCVFDLCLTLPQPIVFILWGANARRFTENTDFTKYPNKGCISSSHPSPLSAYSGRTPFFGSRPFSRANIFLIQHGSSPVNWALP